MKERNDKPTRYRKVREDASIGSTESNICKVFGLPDGSVTINNPNGRNARSDKGVGKLRNDYDKK